MTLTTGTATVAAKSMIGRIGTRLVLLIVHAPAPVRVAPSASVPSGHASRSADAARPNVYVVMLVAVAGRIVR